MNKCPFSVLASVTFCLFFSAVLSFLLVIWLFNMAFMHSAKVLLSSVPKCKKAVICLAEQICVLHKFGSDMSYSAVGYEFSVNEIIYIYIKHIHDICECI